LPYRVIVPSDILEAVENLEARAMRVLIEQPIDYYCVFCLTRKGHTTHQHLRSIRQREAFMAGRIDGHHRCG
jgi:hypothetical protein